MFVTLLGSDNCTHYVNTEHIAQVVRIKNELKIEFSYVDGKNNFQPSGFQIKNIKSQKALLSALKVKGPKTK